MLNKTPGMKLSLWVIPGRTGEHMAQAKSGLELGFVELGDA